jgi:hypothetical protein
MIALSVAVVVGEFLAFLWWMRHERRYWHDDE